MSEQAPERPGGGGNVFTRKIGPLPMWGWMLIALLLAVFYYLYKKNQTSSSTAQTASTVNTPGGVDASLVPQFVNQTYVQNQPPTAPDVTVNNTVSEGSTAPPPSGGTLQETFSKGHVINPSHGKATVGWSNANVGASGATQLKIGLNGPGMGNTHPVYRYIPASATTATFDNLLANHNYTVTITPVDAKGNAVGTTGNVDLKTK